MRRSRKPRTAGQLIIDLTPLLDVIFIMLIIVLARGTKVADDKLATVTVQTEQAEQREHEAELRMGEALTIIDTYSDIDSYFRILTVSAGYDFENRRNRTVTLRVNEGAEETFLINPSNEDDRWKDFRTSLEKSIDEAEGLPVVLALNMKSTDRMLYRDEQKIREIFEDLRVKYPGIETRIR